MRDCRRNAPKIFFLLVFLSVQFRNVHIFSARRLKQVFGGGGGRKRRLPGLHRFGESFSPPFTIYRRSEAVFLLKVKEGNGDLPAEVLDPPSRSHFSSPAIEERASINSNFHPLNGEKFLSSLPVSRRKKPARDICGEIKLRPGKFLFGRRDSETSQTT